MVETLRSLAELMIWGDQHDTRFFDFFAEKHLLSHFNRILRQPANRRGEVPQQVHEDTTLQRAAAISCANSLLPGVAQMPTACRKAIVTPHHTPP